MKILFHSTCPWSPSSYSILTNRIVPHIVRSGHKVTLSTWFGLQGHSLPWNIHDEKDPAKVIDTITVLPHVGNNYGIDMMFANYKHFSSDIIITESDVWVFPPDETRKMVFCPHFPVDYDPLPDPVKVSLQTAVYPMVYSKFGQRVCEEAGVKVHYVPCGAPSKLYDIKPRDEARKTFAIPDKCDFLVTMVAANKDPNDRKGFHEAIPAFAKFLESHPNACLYIHTNWNGPVQIAPMVEALGIKESVMRPDAYGYAMGMLGEDYMMNVYNASDVLLNPCKSEGWGLPIIEAQMCGTPVALTDFATTEEIFSAGWKLKGQEDWSDGLNSFRVRVYIDDIVAALEDAYESRGNEKLRLKARKGVLKYDEQTVFDNHWKRALKEIEDIVESSKI